MPLSAADTAHLIRRTGFGVTDVRLAELRGLGRAAAVDRVLDVSMAEPDLLEPPALGSFLTRSVDLPLLQRLWLDRMATTQAPLVEKLTLFWHGHFASGSDKVEDLNLLRQQNTTQRRMALGSFVDLVEAMSVDPAMLIYLDNWKNVAASPQENFGREVMEVFTIGPANRSESDVVAMTRAWTGHGLNTTVVLDQGNAYEFHPGQHDGGPKQLFGTRPRNWDGPAAVAAMVQGAKRTETCRFIAAKLFSYLAYPIAPGDPLAARFGDAFSRAALSTEALVRAILLSDEFWSPAARFALVRSPVEWVVAALQATGQSAHAVGPDVHMPQMGQELFRPPSVAGWGHHEYWLSASATWAKAIVASKLRDLAGGTLGVMAPAAGRPPRDATSRAFAVFGIDSPSAATRATAEALVARLVRGGQAASVPAALSQLMMLSPDFQLA